MNFFSKKNSIALATSLLAANTLQAAQKPNVLFILIDDFGWTDVSYNGSKFYETPKLDALSEDWMKFNYFYAPSPMCSPTRASILTGKNPARHGITQWLPGRDIAYVGKGEKANVFCPKPDVKMLPESEITLAETLKENGYETAFYGKWHMGGKDSLAHGFDSERAFIGYNDCGMFYPFNRPLIDGKPQYFPDAKEGDNFTDLLTDAAIDFVGQKRENPFYLHLCYFSMHGPRGSKEDLKEYFEKKKKTLYGNSKDGWVKDPYSHKKTKGRQDEPVYAGQLKNLDANIGRLVETLKAKGLYENTIIVFTGDNGGQENGYQWPTCNAPLRMGKTFLFEGGIRVPTLMHYPKAKRGLETNIPATSTDFYPTILEMAGILQKPEQHKDGISLLPLFNEKPIKRDALFWHFPHYQGEGGYPASAIRMGDFKLIYNYHQNDYLLYNVVEDISETKNLAAEMPEKVQEMKKRLDEYLREAGSTIPAPLKPGQKFETIVGKY